MRIVEREDPYDLAKEKLPTDVGGILRGWYKARVIEMLPAIILNKEHPDLNSLVEQAISEGVQNQLLYILRVTQLLASEEGIKIDLNPHIDKLSQNRSHNDEWLGGNVTGLTETAQEVYVEICRNSQTQLMKECGVFGNYDENTFRSQYKVYRNGSTLA